MNQHPAIDEIGPQAFVDDTIGQVFERLRKEDPVHRTHSSIEGIGDFWSVTRYRDIMHAETHHELFSSDWSRGGIGLMDHANGEQEVPMFIAMDPPRHDAQRKAIAPIAAPAPLAAWKELIRKRTCEVLDGLPRDTDFDWVDRVSIELTALMLATLFDVPLEDRRLLTHWSDMVTALKAANPDAPEPEVRMAELRKMLGYFTGIWNERIKEAPRHDLISMLAHDPSTREMTPIEYMGNLMLLIVGGNDTTRSSMSGGLLALLQHPGEMERLRANPALVASLVPEIIRWQTPLAHMRRTATRDCELGGKTIREGDKLALWYLSANRDEEMIEDPYAFRIDRARANQHLSFGFGIHRCVGSRIAELQLSILWEEILRRSLRFELAGEPVRVRSMFIHGFKSLPVRIRPAAEH